MHQSHLRDSHAKKSLRDITTYSHLRSHHVVSAARRLNECLVAKPEGLRITNPREAFRHL